MNQSLWENDPTTSLELWSGVNCLNTAYCSFCKLWSNLEWKGQKKFPFTHLGMNCIWLLPTNGCRLQLSVGGLKLLIKLRPCSSKYASCNNKPRWCSLKCQTRGDVTVGCPCWPTADQLVSMSCIVASFLSRSTYQTHQWMETSQFTTVISDQLFQSSAKPIHVILIHLYYLQDPPQGNKPNNVTINSHCLISILFTAHFQVIYLLRTIARPN